MHPLKACHCCGMIHTVPAMRTGQQANCVRCGAVILRTWDKSGNRTAAVATAAFILYWPAVLLPILRIEKLGHHHESSLVTGTWELFQHGSWFVGTVVFLFSILFPLTKLVLLLELSLLGVFHRRHKAMTYRVMEMAGKWSMMDVMLLAFLVMLVKLRMLVEFHFGPAVIAFIGCVTLSMIASMLFDPHSIWRDEEPEIPVAGASGETSTAIRNG